MTALNSKTITYEQLAKVIDHSLLRPELTEADVIAGCELAARYHTATVCVKPCDVKLAKKLLKDSDVKVSTTIGLAIPLMNGRTVQVFTDENKK